MSVEWFMAVPAEMARPAIRRDMEFFMEIPPGVDHVALLQDCIKGRLERGGWPSRDSAVVVGRWRKDGWPLCPKCGEDEAYSLSMDASAAEIHGCYACGWRADPPANLSRPDGEC